MPYTSLESASETAERLRCLVAEHTFEAEEIVLKRVDLALYESKEKVRNTVTTVQSNPIE